MVEHLPIRTRALLLGAGLLFAAGAMLGLVLPIRAELEGFPTSLIGLIGSAFAAGYVAGCLYVPRLVAKVGHIRVFGVMAALVAMTALINVLYVSPLAWILVRAMTGFAFAGATMIIESWLSESASSETRGRVFARYMVVNLASSVLGQLAVMFYQPGGFEPFVIVAILACLALIPTALSSSRAPEPLHEVKLDFKRLIRVSPIAVVACFGVGLAQWGLRHPGAGLCQQHRPAGLGRRPAGGRSHRRRCTHAGADRPPLRPAGPALGGGGHRPDRGGSVLPALQPGSA
ncbi:Membrane protein, major facilitator transporter family protein [Ectothiorhodospira sp. PHS-1]|nr:Membrane protein, major facilitator transporter family protein [Ectothiorhodospira sp. PHS-1]